MSTRCISLG